MKNKIVLSTFAVLTALTLTGCSTDIKTYDYGRAPLDDAKFYYHMMEYIAKDDPIRDEISNVFSLPDYELDKKIAGEREGDEQSLAFKSLNTYEDRYYEGLYPTKKRVGRGSQT